MDIFSRYAPFIQDFIYRKRWTALRGVQVAAADIVFNSDDHLLLCASTASGKTEAVFFPILTLLAEDPPATVGALYIAPLKALINDQFGRLTELCEDADVPVWAWHGDVAQSKKQRLLRCPRGILQITPESLEALMIRKYADIPRLFGDLRFIVIDEIHSLMRGDRGGQTICLIERLSRLSGSNPRRIGLSATIGDPAKAAAFLSRGSKRKTSVPAVKTPPVTWRLSLAHFFKPIGPAPNCRVSTPESLSLPPATDAPVPKSDTAPADADPGLGYVFEHTKDKKCLLFANSREEAEAITSTLRHYSKLRNQPDRFLIHHGNLSTAIRTSVEADMRDDEVTATTVTTATLELGIDIGRLERAFQIDSPYSVSAFLQRMGRTGRRGAPPEMWFVMREDRPESRDMLPGTIPWQLLQAIAIIQLYLEEKWVEPPKLDRLPYSLLYHQTMSTLMGEGELTPSELARKVLTLAPFERISPEDYKVLLLHLLRNGHIERTEKNGLIVGLSGERVANNFKFYAVFKENEEFAVRADSQELGTIVRPPLVGEKIAIAGHVWKVDEIDLKRHAVYCHKVEGQVPAFFGLCPGDIHTKILERMLGVLAGDHSYPYLLQNARKRLELARNTAEPSGMLERPLIHLGGNCWCLFPWLGTYAFMALERLLKIRCADKLGIEQFDCAKPYFMQFQMRAGEEAFYEVTANEAARDFDPLELVYPNELPLFEKYDEYLPPELVRKGFAYGILGVEEMRSRVLTWRRTGPHAFRLTAEPHKVESRPDEPKALG